MFIIQKITQRYDKKQDRISLIVQNAAAEVYILWATQRLLNPLVEALAKWVQEELKSAAKGRILPMVHPYEQSFSGGERKQGREEHQTRQLGEVLLTTVSLSRLSKGYQLTFRWDSDDAASIVLSGMELRRFMEILSRQYDAAGWSRQAWPTWLSAASYGMVTSQSILYH